MRKPRSGPSTGWIGPDAVNRAGKQGFEYNRQGTLSLYDAYDSKIGKNRRVRFHLTPTDSSWLNEVEIGYAKIERDVLAILGLRHLGCAGREDEVLQVQRVRNINRRKLFRKELSRRPHLGCGSPARS